MFAPVLLVFALVNPTADVRPPLKKAWNFEPSEYSGNTCAEGNRLYYGNWAGYGLIDIRTGRKIWEVKNPRDLDETNVYLTSLGLFVAVAADKGGWLGLVDEKSGKPKFKIPRTGFLGDFAFNGKLAFGPDGTYTLAAYDLSTKRKIWAQRLFPTRTAENDSDSFVSIRTASNLVLTSTWRGSVEARSQATGGRVWLKSDAGVRWWMLLATPEMALLGASNRPLTAIDVTNGKVRWTSPTIVNPNSAGIMGSRLLVPTATKGLFAVDLATGKVVGRTKTQSECIDPFDRAPVRNGLLYTRMGPSVIALNRNAEVVWKYDVDDDGAPIAATATHLVIAEVDSRSGDVNSSGGTDVICAFTPGTPPRLPRDTAARQVLAVKLVREYPRLNIDQKRDLQKLGRDAFEPLLAEVLRLSREYERVSKAGGDTYAIYSPMSDLGDLLADIVKPSDTGRLLKLLDGTKAGDPVRGTVLGLLIKKGDRTKLVPYFLDALDQKMPDFILYESEIGYALGMIAESSDPRAIDFLIAKLADPKAEAQVRELAYSCLGRTGGDRGREANLSEKHRGMKDQLEPLAQRIGLERASTAPRSNPLILSTKTHSDGTEWALMSSGVLGGWADLWIAHKEGTAWVSPVFTGLNPDEVSGFVKPKPPTTRFKGKTAAEWVKGDWLGALVGDPSLLLDTDGDGLSNVAEARLQTSPNKSDTDGDGVDDQLDPWPTVARRAETDEEKAVEAAYEARYHFGDWNGVAVTSFPDGVKPFEMAGRKSPTLVSNGAWVHPVQQLYERGGILIGFGSLDQKAKGISQMVTMSPDRKMATVRISSYSGGLSGDGYLIVVQKYKGEWIVHSMRMEYVS